MRGRGPEVEHGLVLQGPGTLREHLPAELHVGEHAEIELRFGSHIAAQRVVPDGEVGHLGRIVGSLDETHLVGSRLVELVVVLVLHGIDPVGDRLEVLGDEDTVILGTRNDGRAVLEDRRVVVGGILHRVGRVEPDEALRDRVGLVAVGRIAREDHRVDLGTGREDVAHRIERVALVVVADGASEVERIGRVRAQRVAQLDDDSAAAHGDRRLFLHLGRGEELLLLVLDLHKLVELDVDLVVTHRGAVRREVVGRHGHDHRGQRVARAARRSHHVGTAAQEGRGEEQCHGRAQQVERMVSAGFHRRRGLCVAAAGAVADRFSGARDSFTMRQPLSTSIQTLRHGRKSTE